MGCENKVFCSILLKNARADVIKLLKEKNIPHVEFMKHGWGYKYSESYDIEFHINGNKYMTVKNNLNSTNNFYWSGRGESVTEAKGEGWGAFLESVKTGHVQLKEAK